MAEYIERDKFIKWVEDTYCKPCEEAKRDYNHCRCGACQYDDMMRDAESFESADVAPVRHGRWDVYSIKYGLYTCSECHCLPRDKTRYCPNCGCRMDGGKT